MTDEQINEAIAEACGLKKPSRKVKLNDKGFFVTQHAKLPNYCNDLNAMHEAEKVLMLNDNWRMGEYEARLFNSVEEMNNVNLCFHATARQRAEAFLRTLGKWDQSGDATEMVKEVQK